MKKILSLTLCMAAFVLCAAEFALTKNGKAVSSIVLSKNASIVEKHAADELAKFLAKISKGERPAIGIAPVKGKYPIYIGLTDDKKVKEEGIKISANEKGLYIQGKTPIGTLYGAYEVLKRFTGILWLHPGDDGEYFKVQPTIRVPEISFVKNPDFSYRDISKVCMSWDSAVWDTWDWGVRNNLRFHSMAGVFRAFKGKNMEGMLKRGIISQVGGHCFSPLLVYNPKNRNMKQTKAYAEKLLKEHPDYFPLIRGKRTLTYHGGTQPQPCTSNPAVIELIARNAVMQLKKAPQPTALWFGNNDIPLWCSCKNCLAQDPPEEKKKNIVSTRYWLFANAVFKRIREMMPEAKLVGESYQNYSLAPTGVQPFRDLEHVNISNHRHCWKHSLDDKNCPTNRWYYDYNSQWDKMGIPLTTYEEFITAGRQFIPVEKNWVDNLKLLKKKLPNYQGMITEVCCPDGVYGKRWKNYYTLNNWEMMWQAMYLGMRFHWDINLDYDKEYEKINSLYYGKGWAGGMRAFRKLLTDLYMNASGCHGYGHSTPRGKFLDVPGAKEKLYKYLDGAEKAAAKDSDPRALKHVKRVREFFEKTWIEEYKKYITSFRAISAYPVTGKIIIDGKLDEKDWKNADTTTRFKDCITNKPAKQDTGVKIAYDEDYIYMGIECLEELKKDQLLVYKEHKHDDAIWEDNGIEIFINDPIMGGAYYQFIINHDGVYADGIANPRFDKSYESGMEVKTRFAKGKYIMELKIPVKNITGGKLTAGTVLKMNIMRERRGINKKGDESTTWSAGNPHSVDTFHPVTFAAPRAVTSGNRTIVDTRLWCNGSFDETTTSFFKYKHWNFHGSKIFPKAWYPSSGKQYGGDMEYLLHPGSKTNRFVRLRKGFIISDFGIKNDNVTLVCRLRGKGKLEFRMLIKHAQIIHVANVDSKDWKPYKFTFKNPPLPNKKATRHLILWPRTKDYIDVDDIYVR